MSNAIRHYCAVFALFVAVLALTISVSFPRPPDLVSLAAKIAPAVVAIECQIVHVHEESLFLDTQSGSGVVVDSSGVVVTNFHVVREAISITVTLYNGMSVPATLVGADEASDLAVLRLIGVPHIPYLRVGMAENLQIGQRVVSLGNAHGLGESGEPSLTFGIVSGKHRRMRESEWYEMDAQIYPGSSGGPVCNMSGDVVGINVALSSYLKPFFVPLDAERRSVLQDISDGIIGG